MKSASALSMQQPRFLERNQAALSPNSNVFNLHRLSRNIQYKQGVGAVQTYEQERQSDLIKRNLGTVGYEKLQAKLNHADRKPNVRRVGGGGILTPSYAGAPMIPSQVSNSMTELAGMTPGIDLNAMEELTPSQRDLINKDK